MHKLTHKSNKCRGGCTNLFPSLAQVFLRPFVEIYYS